MLGAISKQPRIRLCSLPAASLMFLVGGQLILFILLGACRVQTPFRISSLPRGSPIRPGIYTVIEDVIAVDTGSGRAYREALNARYTASPMFRRMLYDLNLFWAISAVAVATTVTAVIFAPSVPEVVAYGIGWAVPFSWAGIWALITIKWVQTSLRKEKEAWGKQSNG